MVTVIISVTVSLVMFGAIMYVMLRGTLQRTPAGVAKALRRGDGEHRVRVPLWPANAGARNPAKPPGPNNPIFSPGTGTYRLEANGEVHLHWTSTSGSPHANTGTIPDDIDPGSPQRRRVHRIGGAIISGYLALPVFGFALGYLLSSGRPGVRLGWGLGGIAVAAVGFWIATLIINVAYGSRRALKHQDRRSRNLH